MKRGWRSQQYASKCQRTLQSHINEKTLRYKNAAGGGERCGNVLRTHSLYHPIVLLIGLLSYQTPRRIFNHAVQGLRPPSYVSDQAYTHTYASARTHIFIHKEIWEDETKENAAFFHKLF